MLFSYPILFCLDRCNLEIVIAALVAGALYALAQGRLFLATLCLVPAISIKAYPALLLILVARRNPKWALGGLMGALALSGFSLWALSLSPGTFWRCYGQNMTVYTDYFVYQNSMLDLSGSIWNAGKQLLILASQYGLITPVDFSFDASFIHRLYTLYSAGMLLLLGVVAGYAAFLEKEWMRAAIVLLLYISVVAPSGGDYRLIYAGMAALLLVLTRTRRPNDGLVLIFLALTQVPKQQFVFFFKDVTGNQTAFVSSEAIVDAFLIVGALVLLLVASRAYVDLPWSGRRIGRMFRQLTTRWGRSSPAFLPEPIAAKSR